MSEHIWITNGTAKPFYARKKVQLQGDIAAAEALVCGLGQFCFYVNGKKIGDHELDPGWTDYRKSLQFVRFDIRDAVQAGDNVFAAEVGNGWFLMDCEHYTFHFPGFMPQNPNPYRPFGTELILMAEITVTYQDGTKQRVRADESWKTAPHAITMSNVFGSETMDGTLLQKGWNTREFDDSGWKRALPASGKGADWEKALLREQLQPPVRVVGDYPAKFLHVFSGAGEEAEIYDLGQNTTGILEFDVIGKKGDQIRIYPAEKLTTDGDADQMAKNWMLIDTCITYRIGQDDVWEHDRMRFTYFAGRYLRVVCERAAGKTAENRPRIAHLTAHAITAAWKRDGSFSCDDKRFEQIYDLVEKAAQANLLSVHTDCPTIERFAWQEPNHLMAPSVFYMKDGKLLWEKYLTDLRIAQHAAEDTFRDAAGKLFHPGEGLMPSQAPCYMPNVLPVPGMGSFYDIIPWGSTCILGTYWHYWFYGDIRIVAENYEAGKRYLQYLKTKQTADGFICHGLGDWGNPRGDYTRENIETAFLYADAKVLAEFAELLHRPEDAQELSHFAEAVKSNYNEKLLRYDPERGYYCYPAYDHPGERYLTQAAQALPLYWGMVPQEQEQDVADALRDCLIRDGALICGEVGQPYIIQCARRYDMNDLISACILKKEHPSYYAFVLDGETTLGEYWETNPRSHCHDMMGHIMEWFYNGVAGILPQEPGFRKVLVRPYLPPSMHAFHCTYHSVSGEITVAVQEQNGQVHCEVTVTDSIVVRVDSSGLVQRGQVTVTQTCAK